MRVALGSFGVALSAYGAWLLVDSQDGAELRSVCVWLAAGVVVHDAVLAPVALVLGWATGRVLPRAAAAGAAVVFVVLGPLTLIAVPVLARSSTDVVNPTLLTRDYGLGLLELAVVALMLGVWVGVAVLRSAERRRRGGTDPRRR